MLCHYDVTTPNRMIGAVYKIVFGVGQKVLPFGTEPLNFLKRNCENICRDRRSFNWDRRSGTEGLGQKL